jgi:predicted transcriptional regulator
MEHRSLIIEAEEDINVLNGLASPIRIGILKLLRSEGRLNVNDIGTRLDLPQSTVATNVQLLEEAGLIATDVIKAKKGQQKICAARFGEVIVRFETGVLQPPNVINVAMPLGLFTSVRVGPPCGLCSTDGMIGLLDVPDSFLDPLRAQAALVWFASGNVEYTFPNNARLLDSMVESVEFSMELWSQAPGTNMAWPSSIKLWVNDIAIGSWTCQGDHRHKRGVYTASWSTVAGSQYGNLKTWRIDQSGCFVDRARVSDITVSDIAIGSHKSMRMRIGIDPEAPNSGGLTIFGRGFGKYDQDIVMRVRVAG